MTDGSKIVKQRQLAIRREMDRRGILLKIVAADAGIPYPTLASYFPADQNADPVQIPGGAIYALTDSKALPLDLLSLLQPSGFLVVRVPEILDHDEIEKAILDYAACKAAAHHPESEAGREIGPNEHATLCGKAAHLRVVAG